MNKLTTLLILIGLSQATHALQCEIEIVKMPCWENYNVKIELYASSNSSSKRTIVLRKKSQDRPAVFNAKTTLDCKRGDAIKYFALFNPPIWDNQKGDVQVVAEKLLGVSQALPDAVTISQMTLCYPDDFKDVPYPMEYTPKCNCPKVEEVTKPGKGPEIETKPKKAK